MEIRRKPRFTTLMGLLFVVFIATMLMGQDRITANPTPAYILDALPSRAYLPLVVKASAPSPSSSWLDYLNVYRTHSALPALIENPVWSDGDRKHAVYMVKNGVMQHSENPNNPWYTPEGASAAAASNIMSGSSTNFSDDGAIDLWMEGPFHAVGILDPALLQVGFGSYRENGGSIQMAAALDVIRGQGNIPTSVHFPIHWPGSGATTPIISYGGGEWPDPLASCAGYSAPSGPPIILQMGPGNLSPVVTAHTLVRESMPVEHCIFTESTYSNANSSDQTTGRQVLASRDAVVLFPRYPLSAGGSYTVSITVDGHVYSWSFSAE